MNIAADSDYGTVSHYRDERGFGFIDADSGESIFFHIKNWLHDLDPVPGERVSFITSLDRKRGKVEATDVRPQL
jgi:cold shock CspA family protein